MTPHEWSVLARQINVAWPSRPLVPDEENLYFDVLKGLSSDQVADGILRLVRDGSAERPTAGELYKASAPEGIRVGSAVSAPSRLVVDVSNTPMPAAAVRVPSTTALMSGRPASGPSASLSAPPGTPGIATASMVLGIVALIVPLCGVIALVLGGVALNKIKDIPGQPGRGQATAGLVLGIVFTALWVWAFVMIAGGTA